MTNDLKPQIPKGCEFCPYKHCGKTGDDVTYCMVRILSIEAEMRAKEIAEVQRKHDDRGMFRKILE